MTEREFYGDAIRARIADRDRILTACRASAAQPGRRRAGRVLAAAAAALVVLLTATMSIPKARAAVLTFLFGDRFSAQEYITKAEEEQAASPVPALDKLEVAAETASFQKAFVKAGWEDVFSDVSLTVDRVYLDGKKLFFRGELGGTGAVYLLADYAMLPSLRIPGNLGSAIAHHDDYFDPATFDASDPIFDLMPETTAHGEFWKFNTFLSFDIMPSLNALNAAYGFEETPNWEDAEVCALTEKNLTAYLAGGGTIPYLAEVFANDGLKALEEDDGWITADLFVEVGYCACGEGTTPGKLLSLALTGFRFHAEEAEVERETIALVPDESRTTLAGDVTITRPVEITEGKLETVNNTLSVDGTELWIESV